MKHILLVDDEQAVLDGLRCRLHCLHRQWQIHCADSGTAALEQLQRQSYDLLVTDMRMPGMDGAQLLETVRTRWPHIIRLVLSGYSDVKETARLVTLAHQYLSKPCEPQRLEAVIDRCFLLHDLLRGSNLRAIVGRIRQLPGIPRIYAALQGIAEDDTVSVSEVARLVSTDSAIAAQVLHLVNSAFFRLARRITNIEQAVSYLGFTAIRNVAMSVEVFSQWPGNLACPLQQDKLQAHARAVAAAASALTVKLPIADDTMLAGLLHDIGYWVLAQECTSELQAAAALAASNHIPLYEAETLVLGASHAEIGAYLLGIWGLPYPVIEAVAHHHHPQRVAPASFDVLSALAIAHALVPADDASAFPIAISSEGRLDEHYLIAVNAPFDWSDAQRRVTATLEWKEGP